MYVQRLKRLQVEYLPTKASSTKTKDATYEHPTLAPSQFLSSQGPSSSHSAISCSSSKLHVWVVDSNAGYPSFEFQAIPERAQKLGVCISVTMQGDDIDPFQLRTKTSQHIHRRIEITFVVRLSRVRKRNDSRVDPTVSPQFPHPNLPWVKSNAPP